MKVTLQKIDNAGIVPLPGLEYAFGLPVRFSSSVVSGMAILAYGSDIRLLGPRLLAEGSESLWNLPREVGVGGVLENFHSVAAARGNFITPLATEFDYHLETSSVEVLFTCETVLTVGDLLIRTNRIPVSALPNGGEALSLDIRGLSLWI